jgi:hypothetical protein
LWRATRAGRLTAVRFLSRIAAAASHVWSGRCVPCW